MPSPPAGVDCLARSLEAPSVGEARGLALCRVGGAGGLVTIPAADQTALLQDLAANLHDEPEQSTCERLESPTVLVWVGDGRAAALTRECGVDAWNYRDVDGQHRRWVPSPATIDRIEALESGG